MFSKTDIHTPAAAIPDDDTQQHVDMTAPSPAFSDAWRLLKLLNGYRMVVAALFVTLPLAGVEAHSLGTRTPELFLATSLIYLVFSILSMVGMYGRWPRFGVQVYTQVLVDILIITLLMHASGGVTSGLGMLLLVSVAGGSIMMPGRTAIFFAAAASLMVLAEQVRAYLLDPLLGANYTQAGLLGAAFFATALLTQALAERIRASETLAAQRGVDLANMQQLTEYIIQRMQTGVLVVDAEENVRLINESARHLLGTSSGKSDVEAHQPYQLIEQLCPALAEQWRDWRDDLQLETQAFSPSQTAATLLPRFAHMGSDAASGTLIFLEDTAALAQQAQQMKLASLGRLTASIAHEIRNPLGAISHAAQLLAESPAHDTGDARFIQIIGDQARRVNTIIENILQLSRRERSHPQEFMLKDWLETFVDEFSRTQNIDAALFAIEVKPRDLQVRIDPSQLHQILWNLCDNALRHGTRNPASGETAIHLRSGIMADTPHPFLDVIDRGPAIAKEVAEHIFEPFFTTAPQGTGLGLYICRELCECNQARLNYLVARNAAAQGSSGNCFRITFADPRRKQVA